MFHGIEELERRSDGYVYWKGAHVEHYTFRDEGEEAAAAHELAGRCRHLESIGVQPSPTKVVWQWDIWKGITQADDPLLGLMTVKAYEANDGASIIVRLQEIDHDDDNKTRQVWHRLQNGRWISDVEVVAYWWRAYHELRPLGFDVPRDRHGIAGRNAYSDADELRHFWNRHGIYSIDDLRAAVSEAEPVAA